MLRTARNGREYTCTATMVAPNLALTARHCVSDADQAVSCSVSGEPLSGGAIDRDYNPAVLRFFTGTEHPERGAAPSALGARVIHDGARNLCAHDLAFVLLDRALATPIASLRLDADPQPGEAVRVIGWGLVDDATEALPTVRQRRDVRIIHVGPRDAMAPYLTLTPAEFSLGESICEGDSGGPVIARETGAVVGVISRGDGCFGAGEFNVMTKIAPFRTVIDAAFGLAGARPVAEPRVVIVGGGGGGLCGVSGGPTDAFSTVLFSAFFLWARRRLRRAK